MTTNEKTIIALLFVFLLAYAALIVMLIGEVLKTIRERRQSVKPTETANRSLRCVLSKAGASLKRFFMKRKIPP